MAATEHGGMAGSRFVDPSMLARIGNLELLARTVVDGFINGLHRAPYFDAPKYGARWRPLMKPSTTVRASSSRLPIRASIEGSTNREPAIPPCSVAAILVYAAHPSSLKAHA